MVSWYLSALFISTYSLSVNDQSVVRMERATLSSHLHYPRHYASLLKVRRQYVLWKYLILVGAGGGGCTNLMRGDSRVTKFYTVATEICAPLVWILVHVNLLRLGYEGEP